MLLPSPHSHVYPLPLLLLFLLLLALLDSMSAASAADSTAPHGTVALQQSTEPRGWTDEGPVLPLSASAEGASSSVASSPDAAASAKDLQMSFRLLLMQNKEQLQKVFEEVSDPVRAK